MQFLYADFAFSTNSGSCHFSSSLSVDCPRKTSFWSISCLTSKRANLFGSKSLMDSGFIKQPKNLTSENCSLCNTRIIGFRVWKSKTNLFSNGNTAQQKLMQSSVYLLWMNNLWIILFCPSSVNFFFLRIAWICLTHDFTLSFLSFSRMSISVL